MIHDECTLTIDNYVVSFINDRTKINYDILKDKLFDYLEKTKKYQTPVTNQLKTEEKQINSLGITILDCNQTRILDTYDTTSNTYDNFINYTLFSMIYNIFQ